jgi:hypothetical protein
MRRLLLLLALAGMVQAEDVRTMGRGCDYNITREVTDLGDNTYLVRLSGNQYMNNLKIWDTCNQTPTILNASCAHTSFNRVKGAVEVHLYGGFNNFSCSYTIKTRYTPFFRGYYQFITEGYHLEVCDVKEKVETTTTTLSPMPKMMTTTSQTTTSQENAPTTQEISLTTTITQGIALIKPKETPSGGLFDGIMYFFTHLI